jgi:hypothetical protein
MRRFVDQVRENKYEMRNAVKILLGNPEGRKH